MLPHCRHEAQRPVCRTGSQSGDTKSLGRETSRFQGTLEQDMFGVRGGGPGRLQDRQGDDLDLSCDELWENGMEVKTPFGRLMSFSDLGPE